MWLQKFGMPATMLFFRYDPLILSSESFTLKALKRG